MKGHLVLSKKELARKSVLDLVGARELTLKAASERLGMSYRAVRRCWKRYAAEGDAGLIHRNRGRKSNRAKEEGTREAVLEEYREHYSGWGPTFAAEKLQEEGYAVDHETLRRWLLQDGQWVKRRKRSKHRSWRERKGHFGELVQLDGSPHRWFGPDHPPACLMNMVDDARGVTLALLSEEETTESAMRLLWDWVNRYGIPQTLYTDQKNVYVTDREPTLAEELAGETPLTAFGKACKTLGITIIRAHSPQAKGRVERNHGVYQDRFIKELALAGITTIAEANGLLRNGFTEGLNARFARPAREELDLHRPVPSGLNLAEVFCWEEERVVQHDWTVRYANHRYQIEKTNRPLPHPQDHVVVRTRLDGSMALLYRDRLLDYHLLPPEVPRPVTPTPSPKAARSRPASPYKARKESPWRQGSMMMSADTSGKAKETGNGKGGAKDL